MMRTTWKTFSVLLAGLLVISVIFTIVAKKESKEALEQLEKAEKINDSNKELLERQEALAKYNAKVIQDLADLALRNKVIIITEKQKYESVKTSKPKVDYTTPELDSWVKSFEQ